MSEWHYAQNDQQLGPVTAAQLKQLATSGQLQPSDLIWKEGMADWVPASRLKGLFGGATQPAAVATATVTAARPAVIAPPVVAVRQPTQDTFPAAQQPAAAIPNVNPGAGFGTRVAQTLKGFPPTTGAQGEWPLSAIHLAQLKEAEKLRKTLRGFNSLCQLFALVCALVCVGVVIQVANAAMSPNFSRAMGGESLLYVGLGFAIVLGLAALYYSAGRAGLRCQRWGPISVLVLVTLGILSLVASINVTSSTSRVRPDSYVGLISTAITLLLGGGCALACIRALVTIPKFLACPVWTQEALVNAKL